MLKINSAASTGSHGKYMKYISFPWQYVIITGLHEHSKAVERNVFNIASIQLCPAGPTTLLKLCRR